MSATDCPPRPTVSPSATAEILICIVGTGEALVGNLGSDLRMEFTAVGDSVNVAARLENLARPGQTLVTARVAERAGKAFELRSLGPHPIRGKTEPVELFELMS